MPGLGPLFATLSSHDRYFAQKEPIELRYLPKAKGIRARQLIQGLMVAKREDISLENISDEQLIKLSAQLGETGR